MAKNFFHLFIFLLAPILGLTPVYADDDLDITFSTDLVTYSAGMNVQITAQVRYQEGTLVGQLEESKIQLKDSRGETVKEGSMQKVKDGTFSFSYLLPGDAPIGLWGIKAGLHSHEGDRESEWEGDVSGLF